MALLGLGKKRNHTSYDAAGSGYSHNSAYDDLTVKDYAQGMPNIRLSDAVGAFFKQFTWMIPLFLIGACVAFYMTRDFKRVYTADGSLMVQLGPEHVFQSVVNGETGQNAMQLTPDSIILTEVGIIKNSEVIDSVIGKLTSNPDDSLRFDKAAEEAIRAAGGNQALIRAAQMERRKRVDESFVVMPQPKSSIINLAYKHENPDIAVVALNAFIDEYKTFRRTVFVEGNGDIITQRRIATEEQLKENEASIARFLRRNDISNFTSEQTGYQKRTEDLKALLNTTRASISETEAALAIVENQLRQTPPTIDLYVDDRASQRIAQAELELGQLLAKYLPTSDPVRQKQAELDELRSVKQGYNGQVVGGRRQGPNPNFQTLTTRRNLLQSTADGLREKEFELQQQLNATDAKLKKLTQLSPEYQNLVRERTTLAERLDVYNTREQEALINQDQAEANSENVREIARARYPQKGRNMRMWMFLLASVFWGFALFMIAMARVFLNPALYSRPASLRVQQSVQNSRQDYGQYADPIPEPVKPAFVPEEYQPAAASGYAQSGYEQNGYDHTDYGQGGYAQPVYNDPAQGYGHGNGQQNTAMAYNQSPQSNVWPTDGNAARDIYANPYATPAQDMQGQVAPDMNVLGTVPQNTPPQRQ